MAWNPSKEVAVARDAAKALDAPICVVIYLTKDGRKLGTASYGKTPRLCGAAKKLGRALYDAAMEFWDD